jgi:CRP/FNR family transcriptional regulator, cyclic AMP receptor protein
VSLQKDVEVLRSIPLFAKIEPAKLKLLAFTSEHLEFAEGDTLCRQGEAGDAAFIVLEGQADVLVENPGGAVKVATIHRNDIVGEIAILCDVPRTATVVAHGDLETLRVCTDGFFHLVTQFPQVGIEVMCALAWKLHQTTQALTAARVRLNEFAGSNGEGAAQNGGTGCSYR